MVIGSEVGGSTCVVETSLDVDKFNGPCMNV